MQCVSLCWRTCRCSGARTLARRLSLSRKLSSRLRTSKSDLTSTFFVHIAHNHHILTYHVIHIFSQKDIRRCNISRDLNIYSLSRRSFISRVWTAADISTLEILLKVPIISTSVPFSDYHSHCIHEPQQISVPMRYYQRSPTFQD